ncbi:MAG: hypothetical protein IKJ45_07890 [Kiritimatiellae bacterium]|nr:hypothetical protein [Kiritimatiellia bacterium]
MNGLNETGKGEFEIRPRYMCCHPNPKGTGVSVKFELHPAHEYVEGSIFATFASQKTVGVYGEAGKIPPTFDWRNSVTVRLTINEIAEMLEVFRGYREKMGDGKGLFHCSECGNTVITLEHRLEHGPGYLFGVSRKSPDGELRRMHILLSMKETIVLSEALSSSMLYMAFGIPKVLSRSERRSVKEGAANNRSKEVA